MPFLGSAASRVGVPGPTQLPDGNGLAHELLVEMGVAYPGDPSDNLALIAQYYERPFLDRVALYEYMHQRFFRQQVEAPLARVAQVLASIPGSDTSRFLVTTNYDVIIERAFREAGRPICVITQNMRDPDHGGAQVQVIPPDGTPTVEEARDLVLEAYPRGTTFLFKMHGSAHNEKIDKRDDLIITENDYVDFLVNAGGRMSPNFPPACLAAAFKTRRFLFLGYSLRDWNFRAFLRLLELRNALSGRDQLRHLAVQMGPGQLEIELWNQRNVNVYDGDLLQFCDRLAAAGNVEPVQ